MPLQIWFIHECHLFFSKAKLEQPWYDEKSDDNEVAREAFQSLMTITLKKPNDEKYRNFSMEVKKRAKEEQNDPNFEYGEDEVNNLQCTPFNSDFIIRNSC